MGIDVYLLACGGAVLEIGGLSKRVGTLRRLCKWTEMNAWRAAEMEEVHAAIQNKRMPTAVLAWGADMRMIDASRYRADGRVVLAWEFGRSYVSDTNWDHLPVLGYAAIDGSSGHYVLHEERGGFFVPVSLASANKRGILDQKGRLVRLAPPRIVDCQSVSARPSFRSAVANCILSNGERCEIWTTIGEHEIPNANWYLGKMPRDVADFSISSQKLSQTH